MAGKNAKPMSQSDQIRSLDDARKAKAQTKPPGERKDDGTPKNNLQAIREAEQAQLLSELAK